MQRKVILSAGALILGATLLLQSAAVHAADAVLDQMYGDGVHAFNIGDYTTAHAALSEAIDAGSKDPRAFYFRGLSYLRLGRGQEAEADFTSGADLEVTDGDRFFNVSKALARIQGPDRLKLEKKRAKARVLAFQERERLRVLRYQEIREADEEVLLRPVPAAVPRPAAPAEETVPPLAVPADLPAEEEMPAEDAPEVPADEPVEDDPFAPDPEATETETETEEVTEEVTEEPAATEEEMPAEDEAVEEEAIDEEAVEEEATDDTTTEEPAEEAPVEEPATEDAAVEDADAEAAATAEDSNPFDA